MADRSNAPINTKIKVDPNPFSDEWEDTTNEWEDTTQETLDTAPKSLNESIAKPILPYTKQMGDYAKDIGNALFIEPFKGWSPIESWKRGDVEGMLQPIAHYTALATAQPLEALENQYLPGTTQIGAKFGSGDIIGGLIESFPILGPRFNQLLDANLHGDATTTAAIGTQLIAELAAMKIIPSIKEHAINTITDLMTNRQVPVSSTSQSVANGARFTSLDQRAPTYTQYGRMDSQHAAAITQPLMQDALTEMGGNTRNFPAYGKAKSASESGPKRVGARFSLDVVDHAINKIEQPMQRALSLYGTQKVPNIQQSIIADLTREMNSLTTNDPVRPALEAAISELTIDGNTVTGLNKIRVKNNKLFQRVSTSSESQQIAATAQSIDAARLTNNAIRNRLYPQLEQWAGPESNINFRDLGHQEAALIQLRNGMQQAFLTADKNEALWQSRGPVGRVFSTEHSGGISDRWLAVRTLRALGISPMGEYNRTFRKSLGTMGKGGVPYKVTTDFGQMPGRIPPSHQLPSGPGGDFKFQVQMDENTAKILEREIGIDTGTTDKIGITGDRNLATGKLNKGLDPYNQSGTIVTPPTPQPKPFDDPNTYNRSNWQYIPNMPSRTGMSITENVGVIVTNDLTKVLDTIKVLDSKIGELDSKIASAPPAVGTQFMPTRTRLKFMRDDLESQVKQYTAYSDKSVPPSVRLNLTHGKSGTKPATTKVGGIADLAARGGLISNAVVVSKRENDKKKK